MNKPTWLADLRPLERRQAERWLAQVGENRFMAIAKAATAVKRPRNRPRADHGPLISDSLVFWITHPELTKAEAAGQMAATTKAQALPGSRYGALELQSIRTIIRNGLRDPSVSLMIEAEEKASRLGLEVRADAWGVPVPLPKLPRQTPMAAYLASLTLPEDGFTRHLRAHLERAAPPTMPPEQVDRLQRIGHLLRALRGLVSEDIPISRVTTLFDDMVALLNDDSA